MIISDTLLYLQQAVANIKNHLLRSFLTLLGVLVGTAAIVALLTGSELATQSALSQFKKLGTDLLALNIGENKVASNQLNIGQVTKVVPGLNLIAPYASHYSTALIKNNQIEVSVLGVTQALQSILKLELIVGRFVSNLDNHIFYCIIGSEVAQLFNSQPLELIGQQIRLNNNYFTIIGVLAPTDKNLFLFADSNQSIFIPLSTSLLINNDPVNNFLFKLQPNFKPKQVEQALTVQLQNLMPGTPVRFTSPETIIQNMEDQNRIFKLLLGFIGGIALLVGGIGVMNIMLVSVSERRREIGIRMAVGAQQKDILYLFLAEATVLTLLGGVIGVLIGELLAFITAKVSHWEFKLLLLPISIGFLVSVAVGLFFGFYPAKKASKQDPIEILRTA